MRFASSLAAAVVLLAPVTSARANGRYPASSQIVADPANEDTMVVRATYGLLFTHDRGKHWGWVCESAVGYGGSEDPMLLMLEGGTVLAGLLQGLAVSNDGGCDWAAVAPLTDIWVTDLTRDPRGPKRAVALTSGGMGPSAYTAWLWQSADAGASWSRLGSDLPGDLAPTTVDTAWSDDARIYVAGVAAPGYAGVFERSTNGAASWTRTIPSWSDAARVPYIAGVSPVDADRVFVRMDNNGSDAIETLESSTDGGDTWTTAFTAKGHLAAFALSPDGSRVAVGGETDGIWVAPTSTLSFVHTSTIQARCLAWTARGLYACADETADGFEVGLSTNEGASFVAFAHMPDVCPLACDPASSVGATCGQYWPAIRDTVSSMCGETHTKHAAAGGCGCRAASTARGGAWVAAGCALALVMRRRRSAARAAKPRVSGAARTS